MGAFEHVISLLSFVFALAITHLLMSVAGLIRNAPRVRWSGPAEMWMLNGLVTVIANWISFWDMRALTSWSIGTIFFTFGLSFVTYLQVALVCPDIPADGAIDLARFHDEQSKRYIGAFLLTCGVAVIANFVFGGVFRVAEWNKQNLAVLPMIAIALAAIFLRARWVQIAAPLALMAVWVYYFVTLQSALK